MTEQSTLAILGLRLSTLGSLASLAIAAPLAEGDFSQAAHTDATRTGFHFASRGISMVSNGVERLAVLSDGGIDFNGIITGSAPALSAVDHGTIFYNKSLQKFQYSTNGSSYTNFNPMSLLGDIIYGGVSGVPTQLLGNTTATKKFLAQTGTGTISAAPIWDTIASSDVSGLTAWATKAYPTDAAGLLRNNGSGTLSWDTASYLTANQTITLSSDVTGSGTTSITTTIAAGVVTLAKMANLSANSIIGNNTGSAATPLALTGTQVTAMLDTFSTTATTKGLVPGSNSVGTTYFLRSDGSWAVPGGGGNVTGTFVAGRVPYASGTNTLTDAANFTYSTTTGLSIKLGSGSDCTTVGSNAMNASATGAGNSAFGSYSLWALTNGASNSAFGSSALSANTTGGSNCAFGQYALSSSSTLSSNNAFGTNALSSLTSGTQNVAFGRGAGSQLTTGSNNVFIGCFTANSPDMASGSNNIFIGTYVSAPDGTTSYFVAGSNTASITNVFIGNGVTNTTPTAITYHATGGSGTNIAGAALNLAGGIGTGTGVGGKVSLQTAKAGTTGSTPNTLVTRLSALQDGAIEWTGIATASAPAVSAANNGTIFYDSTLQKFRYSANNGAYADLVSVGSSGSVARATADVSTVLSSTTCYFTFTGSTSGQTLTLPAANLYGASNTQMLVIRNKSSVTVTVTRAGSDTIDGVASIILAPGDSVFLFSDGSTAWDTN